jgi:hypothetical protein
VPAATDEDGTGSARRHAREGGGHVAAGDADSRARARSGVVRRPEGIRRSQRERSVGTGRVTVRPCRVARAPPRPRPDKPGRGDRDAVVIRFGAGGADAAPREGGPAPRAMPPAAVAPALGWVSCLPRQRGRRAVWRFVWRVALSGRSLAGGRRAGGRPGKMLSAPLGPAQRSAQQRRPSLQLGECGRGGWRVGGCIERLRCQCHRVCVCDAGPAKAIRLFGRMLLGFRVGERVPVPVPCVLPDGSVRRCGVRGGTRCSVPPWTADCDGTTFVPGV